jgi:hypothetical protein
MPEPELNIKRHEGRDPQTGKLYPGTKLPGAGNPLSKAHLAYRMRLIQASDPADELAVWAEVVKVAKDSGHDHWPAAVKIYMELLGGKNPQNIHVVTENSSTVETTAISLMAVISEADPDERLDAMRRILKIGQYAAIEGPPDGCDNGSVPA